jgi:hypothetical protein
LLPKNKEISMNFGTGAEPEQERTDYMAGATLCSEPQAQASQPGLQQVQVSHLHTDPLHDSNKSKQKTKLSLAQIYSEWCHT